MIVIAASQSESRHKRSGFTLIELVSAMAVLSILVVVIGSAMAFAIRAIPSSTHRGAKILSTGRITEQIAEELEQAKSFTIYTATDVEFTVADRDNDTIDETIRYVWSGTPGAPLERYYNGTPIDVIDEVQAFQLDYFIRNVDTGPPPPGIESAEQTFVNQPNIGEGSGFRIEDDFRMGQSFKPTLPPDATSWKIKRATFIVSSQNPKTGSVSIEIQTAAAGGEPSGTVVDAVTVPESDFGKNQLYEVNFPNGGGLVPGNFAFVTFRNLDPSQTSVIIKTGLNSTTTPDTHFFETDINGANWTEDTARDIRISIYGTYFTPDPNYVPPTTGKMVSAKVLLNTTTSTDTQVRSSAMLWNQPGVN